MSYKLIDLFAGAGGMTLGFTGVDFCGGFSPILAVDNDASATKTHERNFKSKAICGNIEVWLQNTREVPSADVVIGGPPCQGFSLLNKQRQGDARRALWEPFLDVVERAGARIFVMENVSELLRSDEFLDIRSRAIRMGFEVSASILNAADYGAPQTRKRTIILGTKGVPHPSFPPHPTHSKSEDQAGLLRWRTVRDAIGDLPKNPIGTEFGSRGNHLDLHFGRTPTPKSLKRYRAVPQGGNRFDLQLNAPELTPDCWLNKPTGSTDLFGRLWWDRPAVTIRTEFFKPEKGRYLHPDEDRPITHREAARLMGFPDDFVFVGSKIDIARQIGNAVPPPLAGAIAKMVLGALESARSPRTKQFRKPRAQTQHGEAVQAI